MTAALARDAEGARRLAVPVREQRHRFADTDRLRPGSVRPDGVARDAERPDVRGGEVFLLSRRSANSFVHVGDQSQR